MSESIDKGHLIIKLLLVNILSLNWWMTSEFVLLFPHMLIPVWTSLLLFFQTVSDQKLRHHRAPGNLTQFDLLIFLPSVARKPRKAEPVTMAKCYVTWRLTKLPNWKRVIRHESLSAISVFLTLNCLWKATEAEILFLLKTWTFMEQTFNPSTHQHHDRQQPDNTQ